MSRRTSKRKMTQREGGKATGRPKRDRTPDRGTPELQQKRQALVGEGGDATLSTRWLHILVARGLLDVAQQQAGESFARDRCLLYGRGDARASLLDRDDVRPGRQADETKLEEVGRRYRRVQRRLRQFSDEIAEEVQRLVVHDEQPMIWAYLNKEMFPSATALRQWARIVTGLDVLADMEAERKQKHAA